MQMNMNEVLADFPYDLDLEALSKSLRIKPDSEHLKEFTDLAHRVREVARPKALYKESFVEAKQTETVTIDAVTFRSRILRKNLDGVERVFPYIATCGAEVDGIHIPQDDFLAVFWHDAIKAALLASSIRYLSEFLKRKYLLGKTSVMSPGSGDVDVWPIEQQREFFSLFGDVEGAIGVRLTPSFLMLPNKSVSGIRFPTEIDYQNCQLCHREKCPGRRAPFSEELWESVNHQ